jgi:tyrosyl-tRNA synthetase
MLTKLVSSKSEGRRMIEQGGVKINQQAVKDEMVYIGKENNLVIQVGKRKFVKIK